jgi:hypothetical protein
MSRIIAIHQGPDGRRSVGPPRRDDRFIPVIDWAIQAGELGNPWLVPVVYTQNRDEAEAVRKSLYAAARYYCSCGTRYCTRKYSNIPSEKNPAGGCPEGGQRISCQAHIVKTNGVVRVQFKFFDKRESMREVIAKYGPDPSKWPYSPWAKKIKEK